MRTLDHPSRDEMRLDTVLAALADPVRRTVACKLNDAFGDHACATFELPVSKSTATYHFRTLREAGVIRQEYEGTKIMNTCARTIDARFPGSGRVFAAQDIERAEAAAPESHD
uniref:Putative regulator n=1 Tax=Brevibacterium sp. HCU TaxID=133406 RepID=Q93QG2_9MICO|nr:putative regulator [Brevibacterium sp. HCU]